MLTVARHPPGLASDVERAILSAHESSAHLPDSLLHARRALELARSCSALEQAAAAHLLICGLHRAGLVDEARELALEYMNLVRTYAEGPFGAAYRELLRIAAICAAESGHFALALSYATEHYDQVHTRDLDQERVPAMSVLGLVLERAGDPWLGGRLLHEAVELGRQQGGGRPLASAMNNLMAVLLSQYHLLREAGEAQEADRVLIHALDLGMQLRFLNKAIGDSYLRATASVNLAEAMVFSDGPSALQHIDEVERLSSQAGYEGILLRAHYVRGCHFFRQRDFVSATTCFERARSMLTRCPQELTGLRIEMCLHDTHRAVGKRDEALLAIERVHALERKRMIQQLQARCEHLISRVQADENQRRVLDGAYQIARAQAHRAQALERMALADELTGLANRRALDAYLDRAAIQADNRGGTFCVVVLDLDHFKQINDRFGHPIGDQVLKQIARLLTAHTRNSDLVARPGGEEFVLVYEGVNPTRAVSLCERLRLSVADYPWHTIAEGLTVTFSAGIASYPRFSRHEILEQADLQMYRAKRMGRNRVSVAP